MKTNAVRLLDRVGIAYELRAYDFDAETFSAEQVAVKIQMDPETVFKTLLIQGHDTGHLFALIPAGTELDLRALAAASGNKRVALVPLRDVLALTGYERGAVTPLAARRAYPVYIDETMQLWPRISLSAGMRGLQVVLTPSDLLRVTEAHLADIAGPPGK